MKASPWRSFRCGLLPLAIVVAFSQGAASGATLTWTGGGSDNNVLNGLNWNTGNAPAASGDALVFTGSSWLGPTLSANRSVTSITFNSAASAFTLGGSGIYTLTASGGVVNSSTATQTINNALIFGGNQNWGTNAGTIVVNGTIDNGSNLFTLSGSTGTVTLNGVISGSGGLTKSGAGTLNLNGANTYSGTTTLSGGSVVFGNDSAVGTGSLRFNSKTMTVSAATGGVTLANAYTLGSNLVFGGSNNLTLTGATALGGSKTVTVNGTGVLSLTGVISGSSRNLTKAGTGTLILSGANTMKAVKLNAGTLYAGNASALGSNVASFGTANFGTTSALTFANGITFTGNTTFIGSNASTFNGAITLGATRTLTFNGSAPVTFNGVISGAGFGINKAGAGTFAITGTSANTFTGLTKINDGTVTFGKTAGVNAIGGSLEIGDGSGASASAIAQLNASNQIPDASTVGIFTDGQFKLQSFNETVGAVTMYGGSITGTGTLSLGGDLTFSGINGATALISAPVALLANRTFLVNSNGLTAADLSVSGPISGAFSLTKTGAGNLALTGSNSFSGGYVANAGTTLIGNATALGSAAAILGDASGTNAASMVFDTITGLTVGNAITVRSGSSGTATLGGLNTSGTDTFGGAITLNKSVILTAEAGGEAAFTGAISGTGGFTKLGAGTVRLSGSNTSSGAMSVSAGTLALGASNALGSGALTVDGGILDFGSGRTDSVGAVVLDNNSSITGSGGSALTSTGNFDLRSGTIQVALAGSGSLTKSTSGSVTLSGVNTYSGTTTVSAGNLILGVTNSLPTNTALSVSSGAAVELRGFATQVGSVAGAGNVLLDTATLTAGGDNTSTTFSGVLSGTGGLTKTGTGTLTLSGSNSYTGATTVSAGTVLLGASNALNSQTALTANGTFNLGTFSQTVGSLAGSGTVTLGGGTFTAGAAGTSTNFSGAIGGTGNFVKSGAGTLTLSGANGTTAAVEVSGGTLTLSGASGALGSASSITLDTGATLKLDNSTTENANRIGNSTGIRLAGGTLQLISDNTGTNESVGALTVVGGSSTVNVTHNGGALTGSALTFSSLGTVANGATVNFSATGGTLGASILGPQIYITGQSTGLLGGWATVGADAAEYYLFGIRAFSAYYEGSLGININDTTKIVRLSSTSPSGAYTLTNSGVTTDLGLNLTDISSVDLSSDSTRTLNLLNGSLIKSTGTASTISGLGKLTAGGTSAGNLNVSVTPSSSLTISASITDNTGGAVGFAKSDTGTLTLSGTNTFTGNVFANGGTLAITSESNLGNGTKEIVFNGGSLQVNSSINLSNSKAIRVSPGLTGTLDIAASQSLTLANNAGMLISGDSASTLIKSGAGSLVIQNANSGFTGNLRIDQGITELRNAGSAGTGTIQLNGGTLGLVQNSSTAFNNNVTMLADSTINVARLSGSGAVTDTLGTIDLGARTLTVTGDGNGTLQANGITLSGAGIINTTTADLRSGAITGSNALTKTGAGALILTGSNSYTGATNINNGTLRLAGSNLLPDTTAVTLAGGTSFDLAGFSDTIGSLAGSGNVTLGAGTLTTGTAGSTTYAGGISGTGGLVKSGTGTFTLSGTNTYTGSTTINAGTLLLNGANRLSASSDVTIATDGTLDLGSNSTSVASLAGAGTLSLGSATLTTGSNSSTFSGTITGSGGLAKTGSGTLTLSGTSSYTGTTAISNGVIVMRSSSALGGGGAVTVASGSALDLENNVSVGSKALSLAGTGISGTGALLNNSGANTWSGPVSLTAATTIGSTAGTLALSGTTNLGSNALTVTGSGNTTFSGSIGGSGSGTTISKSGSGTLLLSGANTYTGVTSISQGILMADNATALGATGSGNGTTIASGATLLFNSASGVAIGDEALSLTGTGVSGNGALRSQSGDNSWAGNLTLTGDTTVRVDSASILHLNGNVAESGGARALAKDGAGTLMIAGVASTTGTISIAAGTLQLDAAERLGDTSQVNVASGGTFYLNDFDETIGSLTGAGLVDLGTDVDAGGGDLTTGGDNGSATFSGVISGLGGLIKMGTGTQTLSGSNTYTGITTLEGGVLSVSSLANGGANSGIGASDNSAANLVLDGGTLRYTGATQTTDRNFTIDVGGGAFDASGTGALTLSGAATLAGTDTARTLTLTGTNTGTNTFAAALTDNGAGATSLTKSGTGTWVISGSQTYTGVTNITGGTLRLASANRMSDVSLVAVSTGATFDLAGFSDTIGSLSGAGNVTLGAGTLTTGGDNTNASFSGVASGTGSIVKSGTGTETFSGANTYTGSTTINAGTLSVASLANGGSASGIGASTNAAGNLTVNGGTLRYTGGTQSTDRNYTLGTSGGTFDASGTGALTLNGAVTLAGNNTARTLTLDGTNTGNNTIAAAIGNNGNGKTALVKNGTGTWVMTGASTFTGNTTVNGGVLAINSGASLGATPTTVASGSTLRNNGSIAGAVTSSGTLTGNGTYSGAVVVNGGDTPGNAGAGIQTFTGGLRFNSTAAVNWELNSNSLGLAGTDYDQLQVTSGLLEVFAGANLNLAFDSAGSSVNFTNTFWATNHSWTIAALSGTGTASGSNAAFTLGSVSNDAFGNGAGSYGTFTTSTSGGNQILTWTSVPEPTTAGLAVLGSALLLRRRRNS